MLTKNQGRLKELKSDLNYDQKSNNTLLYIIN